MTVFNQEFEVARPRAQVWVAFKDTEAVVACLPGAALDGPVGVDGSIAGTLAVKLGPVNVRFGGKGQVAYDDDAFGGTLEGQGTDRGSGSRARGKARFALTEPAPDRTAVSVSVDYTLAGTLAQFARGSIIDDIARRMSQEFASNLEARLAPPEADTAAPPPPPPPQQLDLFRLLFGALWQRLRRLFGRG